MLGVPVLLRLMTTRTRIIRYTKLIGADPGAPSRAGGWIVSPLKKLGLGSIAGRVCRSCAGLTIDILCVC